MVTNIDEKSALALVNLQVSDLSQNMQNKKPLRHGTAFYGYDKVYDF
jgi:hypothetical protein